MEEAERRSAPSQTDDPANKAMSSSEIRSDSGPSAADFLSHSSHFLFALLLAAWFVIFLCYFLTLKRVSAVSETFIHVVCVSLFSFSLNKTWKIDAPNRTKLLFHVQLKMEVWTKLQTRFIILWSTKLEHELICDILFLEKLLHFKKKLNIIHEKHKKII